MIWRSRGLTGFQERVASLNQVLRELRAAHAGVGRRTSPTRALEALLMTVVRSVRAECLDWLLILNRRHLEGVLRVYVDHYNRERPHRALELRPLERDERRARLPAGETCSRDRLGGLIHEYYRAAA